MAITAASLAAKQRILSACVRLFLEKGYKRTTVAEILKAANVSASTFHSYLPDCPERDFYELEIGSSGIIRAYMARSCDLYFTLERKLSRFLTMSLSAYSVPPDEQREILAHIRTLDIRGLSEQVMQELFRNLAMRFSFSLGNS